MIRARWNKILLGASELLLAVGLAFGFFLGLMLVLNLSFPRGTALDELVRARFQPDTTHRVRLEVRDANAVPAGPIALLTEVRNWVKDRPASAVAWRYSKTGLPIEDRHTLQTLEDSSATVTFDEHTKLRLAENSLVVVKRADLGATQRKSMVVLGGQVQASVTARSAGADALDIVTGDNATRVVTASGAAAELSVAVHSDQSSTVSVFAGTAEVEAQGRTSHVGTNEYLSVRPGQQPDGPQPLPDPPHLAEPPDGFVQRFGPVFPQVRFSWSAVPGARGYRLEIAKDPDFDEVLVDRRLEGTELVHGALETGRFYWRVRTIGAGVEGVPTSAAVLDLVSDGVPPRLDVRVPQGVVTSPRVVLRGVTDPGTRIFVAGNEVQVGPGGEFEFAMDLRNGPNVLAVEAVDPVGNTAYFSHYVHAKYETEAR